MLVADTHAHFYPNFSLERALSCALLNLSELQASNNYQSADLCLHLTESAGFNFFERIQQNTLPLPLGYICQEIEDPLCIRLVSPSGQRLFLFAGRQIRTAENLEVLALLCKQEFKEGLSIKETLIKVENAYGTAVIPWSLGKWMFGRAKILRELLAEPPCSFFLSDSYQRFQGCVESAIFEEAQKQGIKILAGSDPLPLRGEETCLGKYASFFEANIDLKQASGSMKEILRLSSINIGERRPFISGLSQQALLALRSKV